MQKKLLSLAVATAMAAPAAVLADATLYGKAHVSIDFVEQFASLTTTGSDGTETTTTTSQEGWGLSKGGPSGKGNPRASRIGVKGSEKFGGGGLKAIYQIEFDVALTNERDYDLFDGDAGNNNQGSAIKMRNSYVGLQGGWGTFLIGRHDTPLKTSTSKLDLFNDRMADYQGTLDFNDVRADDTITYITPDFGGFQFAAAAIPGGAGRLDNENDNVNLGLAEAYSLAAIYKNGPWYGSAAYQVVGDQLQETASAQDAEDYKTLRVGLGIRDLGGFYLSGIYEKQESIDFNTTPENDADLWQVQAGYKFGKSMLKGMYGVKELNLSDAKNAESEKDKSSWAVGLDHSFTKRTTAYALYTAVDVDDDVDKDLGDWSGFSLGIIHNF